MISSLPAVVHFVYCRKCFGKTRHANNGWPSMLTDPTIVTAAICNMPVSSLLVGTSSSNNNITSLRVGASRSVTSLRVGTSTNTRPVSSGGNETLTSPVLGHLLDPDTSIILSV